MGEHKISTRLYTAAEIEVFRRQAKAANERMRKLLDEAGIKPCPEFERSAKPSN